MARTTAPVTLFLPHKLYVEKWVLLFQDKYYQANNCFFFFFNFKQSTVPFGEYQCKSKFNQESVQIYVLILAEIFSHLRLVIASEKKNQLWLKEGLTPPKLCKHSLSLILWWAFETGDSCQIRNRLQPNLSDINETLQTCSEIAKISVRNI